jgi:hypothetical protein
MPTGWNEGSLCWRVEVCGQVLTGALRQLHWLCTMSADSASRTEPLRALPENQVTRLLPGAATASSPEGETVRMIKVRRPRKADESSPEVKCDNPRLPIRWAVIFLSAAVAAGIAYKASGVVPALMTGIAMITVLHQILA